MGIATRPAEEELTDRDGLKVLVVDDSIAQRGILAASLRRHGFDVLVADCGASALAMCRAERIDVVVSDLMMPGMNGIEFCQAFRALGREDYGYFILLTARNERGVLAESLDCGADDFLTKPVNGAELRARIRSGERIVRMQRQLTQKNRLIRTTLSELQQLYDTLDRDLIEAQKLQQSLVRDTFRDFGIGQVSLLLRPAGRVGGDLVGYFSVSDSEIGLYAMDVSGHGITSALMTARLAGHLSGESPEQNLALSRSMSGVYLSQQTDRVVSRFNELMFAELDTDQYFTMVLAIFDSVTGHVRMTQAGHPHPVVQRRDGSAHFMGNGGLPVGLIADAEYEQVEFDLRPGDRLLICSDGITECPDPDGRLLNEPGLTDLLSRNRRLRGPAFLDRLTAEITTYHGQEMLPDDISAVLFEYTGDLAGRGV